MYGAEMMGGGMDFYDFGSFMGQGSVPPDKPKEVVAVDRHPDRNRSGNKVVTGEQGRDVRMALEVRNHGAIVLRASTGHSDGKIRFEGMSIFSEADLLFDKD